MIHTIYVLIVSYHIAHEPSSIHRQYYIYLENALRAMEGELAEAKLEQSLGNIHSDESIEIVLECLTPTDGVEDASAIDALKAITKGEPVLRHWLLPLEKNTIGSISGANL